ncbi:SDR family oxidoreductase [SAR92 clade bacterium H455]|uniref:SDR family oxidoreductase n=1 Tax=SAR92 clade bacterium H455 TaxID=2974818 RepID=A0ABY5TR74_9GAMM|nr:SDR family oxidoreductase [SAR92 clade bacterium H455]
MHKFCQDRVVIITGAGGGLGAAHARVLASHGAKVVINDINQGAAQQVVQEIVSSGGEAVYNSANITDFADSKRSVDQAISEFGALHAVVNNAGNNRDRMFASLSEEDWDAVISVHLKGHFCTSRHAVQYWRDLAKNGEGLAGRIVNTTSGAGLQGSVGQSNYAAAKAGICALTLNQAAELGRYGVTVNAIAPAARTGMTTAVASMAARMAKPEDGSFDYWAPENVSPLVAWLCSENSSHVSGRIFEAEGGKLSIADGWRTTEGIDNGQQWTPETLDIAMNNLLASEAPAQNVYGT